jgi:hypothetical protein
MGAICYNKDMKIQLEDDPQLEAAYHERTRQYLPHENEIKNTYLLHPNHPWRMACYHLQSLIDQRRLGGR